MLLGPGYELGHGFKVPGLGKEVQMMEAFEVVSGKEMGQISCQSRHMAGYIGDSVRPFRQERGANRR